MRAQTMALLLTAGVTFSCITGCRVNQSTVDANLVADDARSEAPEQATQPVRVGPDGVIKLLPAQTEGGRPLMEVLRDRQTKRRYSGKELPLGALSNLLWATFGVNRPDSGKRTAPSAMGYNEIDVYAALPQGLFLYDADAHQLKRVHGGDIRPLTGKQRLVRSAAVDLVFVADFDKVEDMSDEEADFYATVDTGYISQNVYLFCASEELATVAIGYLDRDALSKAMKLGPRQKIILSQAVGYPR